MIEKLSTYHYINNNTNNSIITTHKSLIRGAISRNTMCTNMRYWNYDSILDDETHRAGVWLCGVCEGCLNRKSNKVGYKTRDKLAVRPDINLDELYLIEFNMNNDLVPILHKKLKYIIKKLEVDLLFRAENEDKTRVVYVVEGRLSVDLLQGFDSAIVSAYHQIDIDEFINVYANFIGNKQKGTYRFLGKMYKKPVEIEYDTPDSMRDNKYDVNEVKTWVDMVGQLGSSEGAVMKNLKYNECFCGEGSEYHVMRTVSEQQFLYGTTVLEEYQQEYDEIKRGILGHNIDYKQQTLEAVDN